MAGCAFAGSAGAQGTATLPSPGGVRQSVPLQPVNQPPGTVEDNLELRTGLVCGGGVSVSSVAIKPTTQCGALIGLGFFEVEVGVMGPQANRSDVSGYLSTNLSAPLRLHSTHGSPVVLGGYTRMFETGHALDYGLGYLHRIGPTGDLRYIEIEARDYWAFANPSQHNVVLRVEWIFGGGDID